MQAGRIKGFIFQHWHGRNSLLVTLLGSLLALRVLLGQVQEIVPPVGVRFWVAVSLGIMVWQVVGAFRAGDHALKTQGPTMLLWGVYATILLTIVLSVLQAADAITGRKGVLETVASVVIDPPVMLPLSNGNTTVTIEGEFNWSLRRAFLNTIEANPAVNSVILNSNGGLVYVGRALALTITEKQLSTRVENRCHSACTIADRKSVV